MRSVSIALVALGVLVLAGGAAAQPPASSEPELTAKRLALLREAVPGAAKIGLVGNPDALLVESQVREAIAAAVASGVAINFIAVRDAAGVDGAVAAAVAAGTQALLVLADEGDDAAVRARLVEVAAARRLPALMVFREDAERGALLAYWSELVVNVKTARALGLSLPEALVRRAALVIE